MSPEWIVVASTIAVQLVGIGIIYGRFGEQVKRNAEGLLSQGATLDKHTTQISGLEVRVSVAEAYQQGLQDGTSHMRHV